MPLSPDGYCGKEGPRWISSPIPSLCLVPLHWDTEGTALSDVLVKNIGIRQTEVQSRVVLPESGHVMQPLKASLSQ